MDSSCQQFIENNSLKIQRPLSLEGTFVTQKYKQTIIKNTNQVVNVFFNQFV